MDSRSTDGGPQDTCRSNLLPFIYIIQRSSESFLKSIGEFLKDRLRNLNRAFPPQENIEGLCWMSNTHTSYIIIDVRAKSVRSSMNMQGLDLFVVQFIDNIPDVDVRMSHASLWWCNHCRCSTTGKIFRRSTADALHGASRFGLLIVLYVSDKDLCAVCPTRGRCSPDLASQTESDQSTLLREEGPSMLEDANHTEDA